MGMAGLSACVKKSDLSQISVFLFNIDIVWDTDIFRHSSFKDFHVLDKRSAISNKECSPIEIH